MPQVPGFAVRRTASGSERGRESTVPGEGSGRDVLHRALQQIAIDLDLGLAWDSASARAELRNGSVRTYILEVWRMIQEAARQRGSMVYLYGGGAHTRKLLTLVGDAPHRVTGVLDDAPRDVEIGGLPLIPADQAAPAPGDLILISSDRFEEELARRAQDRYGVDVTLVTPYRILPRGIYLPGLDEGEVVRRRSATQSARRRWGGSPFVGPYERAGYVTGFLEEQWLWRQRADIRGQVLDMSTPRRWHEWVHDLPTVDQVVISDLDGDVVVKDGYVSSVDVRGDFAGEQLPVPPASFDSILCLSILEHCDDPRRMIANLRTALRPGGVLLAVTPFVYFDGHHRPDYWRFCRDGLGGMARSAGFVEIVTGGLGDAGHLLAELLGLDPAAREDQDGLPLLCCLRACRPRNS